MSRDRIDVLYVGGMGRSGSTLLERALAMAPDACGIGESVFLWRRGVVDDDLCGCGEPFSRCPFWTEVGEVAFGGWDRVDPDHVADLRRRVDDVRFVPRLLLPARLGGLRAEMAEYLSYYEAMYAAVRTVSGCRVVVDSSKLTPLVYILSHSGRLRLRLLHMVRDPRAVAYSWTTRVRRPEVTSPGSTYMPQYSPAYMGLLYTGHNLLLQALRLRRVPTVRVRYEDFADDPGPQLRRATTLAGLEPLGRKVVQDRPPALVLDVVHTVAGNPSRFTTGEVAVRRDDRWRHELPRSQQWLVSALTWLPMLWYRYPAAPASAPGTPALPDPGSWPSVTAVVPTHDRPELVRRAIASVVAQDYAGRLETVVVFDKAAPDESLVSDDPRRPVRVVRNGRTPGLAGARNTGIVGAGSDLVAFLDDDDHWESDKLTRQVRRLMSEPGAEFATTAMMVEYEEQGRAVPRLAGSSHVLHVEFLRSRMAMLHSSSFLATREALLDGIGLVDETIPRSMAEDWDLLLRAAERRPVVHLDEPLVRVRWGTTSFFADQWQLRNEAQLWLLAHHPKMAVDRKAAGLSYGKLAFGAAMTGERREAWRWAGRALRADWRQPRTVLALLVATRVVPGPWFVAQLNRRGHGI